MKTRVQCKTCPWKKGADPHAIPRYDVRLHRELTSTIAEPGSAAGLGGPLRLMACQYSGGEGREELPCVGWLAHQLGPGNNLALRLRALTDPSLGEFRVVGPQHTSFADTLPRTEGSTK